MTSFKLLTSFVSLYVAVLLATSVLAAPWPASSKHSTHRAMIIGGLRLESYHPKSTFKTFGTAGASNSKLVGGSQATFSSKASIDDSARSYLSTLGYDSANINFRSGYSMGSSRYAYLRQSFNDIPFSNAVANVGFNGNTVVSYGSSFIDLKSAKIAPPKPTYEWKDALPKLEADLGARRPQSREPTLEYLVKSDGSVALAHVIQLRNSATGAAYEAFVCAHTGELLSVTDFVAHATYAAVPIYKASVMDGIQMFDNPQNVKSSPFGWHNVSGELTNSTLGNNVVSVTFRDSQAEVQQTTNLNFTELYNYTLDPNTMANANAARANAFYVLNLIHDITYQYGFTEEAFNFQIDNFGKGGAGNDPVQVSVQDVNSLNNAGFTTLPDGEPGQMKMYLFNFTEPYRDSALQNDILIHEMAHGITNRMTGGGTARCLQTLESGGLGEGWGDALAGWMQQNSAETKDIVIGQYVTNKTEGIRRYPYSINANTNPLRYSNLKEDSEVHAIGETWANMLHNVYAGLVTEFGYSENRLTDADSPAGNVVFLRLYIDSLALQPCNPTFVDARDAWIQADQNRYNGIHRCRVLKAFASRGLGSKAGTDFVDDGTVPEECK